MKQMLLLSFKLLLVLVLLIALVLGGLLIHGTLTDYKPDEQTEVEQKGTNNAVLPSDSSAIFTFVSWNIGYGGLGEESDFFYDGGKMVLPSRTLVDKNLKGVTEKLGQLKAFDFFLMQEVDFNSQRSHYINQAEAIGAVLPQHNHAEALNFKVEYLPFPFTEPLGKIEGGLATFSKYRSTENIRYQFPGNFAWPKGMYMLDRCFLLQRFPQENGNDLVLINTHNSAYDDGSLKKGQLDYLKKVLMAEYEKGNYVVVGGDWNQTTPDYDNATFVKKGGEPMQAQVAIDADYMPSDWTWIYSDKVATNRKLSFPFDKNKTFTTVIDFFLISPNVEALAIENMDLQFKYSDHQPVVMMARFK